MIVKTGWKPTLRNCVYKERPEEIPIHVYNEALAAKRYYNEHWEFWVWQTAQEYNVSIALAEDACIRGLRKAILQIYVVYGDKIGRWYEDFLDMKDIFNKVNYPIYLPKLGYGEK